MQSRAAVLSDNATVQSRSPRHKRDHHQHQRENNFQSNADISSDNAIAQSNSQRCNRSHHQQRQSPNSPGREMKTYHQVESENPTARPQSQESEY